jgi:hypothetical protein
MKPKDLNKFMERVLVFVDRNGVVKSKNGTPMSSSLRMSYDVKDLKITMSAFAHGMGNGSCGAKVVYKGETVFDASGCFTSSPYNVKATIYKPGSWEKLIKEYPR